MSNGSRIALIIAADEPALFYGSIAAAERDLEAIDVQNGIYKAAYGPAGQRYKITVQRDRVVISADSGQPDSPADLRAVLLRFLQAIGKPASPYLRVSSLLRLCEPYMES